MTVDIRIPKCRPAPISTQFTASKEHRGAVVESAVDEAVEHHRRGASADDRDERERADACSVPEARPGLARAERETGHGEGKREQRVGEPDEPEEDGDFADGLGVTQHGGRGRHR